MQLPLSSTCRMRGVRGVRDLTPRVVQAGAAVVQQLPLHLATPSWRQVVRPTRPPARTASPSLGRWAAGRQSIAEEGNDAQGGEPSRQTVAKVS